MHIHHTVIVQCNATNTVAQLQEILKQLNRLADFPFQFRTIINPASDQIHTHTQNSRCIFFVQTHETNQATPARAIINHYRPLGHQIVLLANTTEDYLDLAIRYGVGNILFEDGFDLPMVRAVIHRLLGTDFFGFGPFFPKSWPVYDQQLVLAGAVNRSGLVERLFTEYLEKLGEGPNRHRFHAHISELLTNAIAYGVLGITAEQRDSNVLTMPTVVEIPPGREIKIHLVQDHEKYGISVKDREGGLTLLRILQKLRRHTPLPGQSFPDGIEDLTGRGLYIVSRQNRLVINILHGVQTEVILLSYFSEDRNRYKSLIINEKNPLPEDSIAL